MRAPENLVSLVEDGLIDSVLRPLQSGKEAQVYLVMSDGEERVAKVYKEANDRSFKNRSDYVEGRGTRNTRDQRAMKRRSRYGRERDEEAWRSAEVEMIYRLRRADVRVPEPHLYSDGVLVMELVRGADGTPAPRLGDLRVEPEQAEVIHDALLRDVVKMLCAGVIHGDLSEFNVLVDDDGPVIIDLPQAVDASSNPNARKILLRDVENLQRFVTRWVPGRRRQQYGAEMWALYERNELEPDTELTGVYESPEGTTDTEGVLGLIDDAELDERERRLAQGVDAASKAKPKQRVFVNKAPRPKKKKPRPAAAKPEPAARTSRLSLKEIMTRASTPAPKPETPPTPPAPKPASSSSSKPAAPAKPKRKPRPQPAAATPSRKRATRSESPRRSASAPAPGPGPAGSSDGDAPTRRRRRRRRRGGGEEAGGTDRPAASRTGTDSNSSSRRPRSSEERPPRRGERRDRSEEGARPSRRRRSGDSRDPRERGQRERDSREATGTRGAKRQAGVEPARKAPGANPEGNEDPPRRRRRRRRRRPPGEDGGSPPRPDRPSP
ncbi:MAG: PA4780 family RIO1-like protein kinase [Acidobacteriota bacterium]